MKKLALLFSAAVVAALLTVPPLQAVEYGGVGGRPANPRADNPRSQSIFVYTLDASETARDGIKIYNNTNETKTISVQAVDAVLASGGAFSCAQAAEPKTGVGKWITLKTNEISLPAGGSKVVPFTITVPANPEVGEHNGCVTVQDISAKQKVPGRNGITLGFRSAIRTVVTVPGKIVKRLSLENVSVTSAEKGKIIVSPTVKNGGNVSLDAKIVASVKTLFGFGIVENHGIYPVLPRSTASWNFEMDKPFWGGWYRAEVAANYNDNPENTLGHSSGDEKTITKSSGIFFSPPTLLAGIIELLILAAIPAAIAYGIKKYRQAQHVREHWKTYTVKAGQTINDVAEAHSISWKQLANANRLKAPYILKTGQKLKVPTKKRTNGT